MRLNSAVRILVASIVPLAACAGGGTGDLSAAGSGGNRSGGAGGETTASGGSSGAGSGGGGGRSSGGAGPEIGPPQVQDAQVAPSDRPSDEPVASATGCAAFTICESFEQTAVGNLPAGWARRPGYGGKSLAVAEDEAARGRRALKIEGGVAGSQFLEYKGDLGALASAHWGRIFFKVRTPAPWPTSGVLHGDLVQHLGPHPGGGSNGVRWGIVENTKMKFQWIFNVQPSQGEPEFGDGTSYDYSWEGRWQCLEWHYDQPQQQGAAWLDGVPLPIQVGKSHIPEIPVFTSLGVGWANYQNAPGAGFVVWIDEVAFHPSRIGCN